MSFRFWGLFGVVVWFQGSGVCLLWSVWESTGEGRESSVDFDDEAVLEIRCDCKVYAVIGKGDVRFGCIPKVLNSGVEVGGDGEF